ncbi:MAG: diphosphomevalonate decarboxylase, partial [Myxococcota bacterium]
ARPPMLYWLPQSVGIMHQVWQARADGVPVYWTMDAGPNVKLLFQRQHKSDMQRLFPTVQVVSPWHGR